MASNPFDQFDAPNPFDQFDEPQAVDQAPIEAAPLEVQAEQPKQNALEQKLLEIPGMAPVAEMAAAANKSIFQFLDFIGPDNVNAVLELAGSDSRVPTFTGSLASDGGYMEEGVARDMVQAGGALLPVAAGLAPVQGRNLATAKGITEEALGLGSAVAEPVKTVTKAAVATVGDALPSKAKEAAKMPLYRGSGDVAAAGFKLDDAGKVVKDKVQQKALKAGLDEGLVAMISAGNKATKSRLKEMVEVLETGKGNLEYRNFNPPQRVVGQAIEDRLKIIQGANKSAAKRLDSVANSLKGKPVDVSPAMNQFVEDLANEGISVNIQTGKLSFDDSTIEGLDGAQEIIKRTFNRLKNTADPTNNAYRVHNAKKFIDEQVSYGKTQAGLSGKMEGIIKRLRHNLDGVLDSNFPEYDQVNSIYAETRGVIDELQSIAGKKVDLNGANVDKALGVMSRKVLSNYASGTAMEDLFKQLDQVANRYSTPLTGGVDDELLKIVSTEAELRRMFPTATKPNTFQGEIGAEVMRGAADVATGNKVNIVQKAFEKAGKIFSKDDEAKIQALKELLSE